MPAPYKNCPQFNAKYHHGVGRMGALDNTSGEGTRGSLAEEETKAARRERGENRDARSKAGACCHLEFEEFLERSSALV